MNRPIANPLLSIVFAEGKRPDHAALVRYAADRAGAGYGYGYVVTHAAADEEAHNWAELLVSGLGFDCLGLAPGPAAQLPPIGPVFGLNSVLVGESISLQPGPHITAGAALPPVVRTLLGLAAALSSLPAVGAVCWHPAGAWMEPQYFQKITADWLQGGVFPALGLTVLQRTGDGAMVSQGLSFFIGQDLRIEPTAAASPEIAARLAVRLIDHLILCGPIREPQAVMLDGLEPVLAVPLDHGTTLSIRPRRRAD